MNRETQGMVLIVVATIVGQLTIQGGYQSYVKSGLFWPLMLSVVCIALVGLASWSRRAARSEPTDDDHEHHGGRLVGLLMLAPVVVLVLVAPAPLGSFAVDDASANQVAEPVSYEMPGLPEPTEGAVTMSIGELLTRAYWGQPEDTSGVPLRLTGFVMTDGPTTERFRLTRFAVACCAADGTARQVVVTGVEDLPETEQWVEVIAEWNGDLREGEYSRLPVLQLLSMTPIEPPEQPYEY